MEEAGKRAATLDATAVGELRSGNKIAAIKQVRAAQGIGLKEAKDMVEDYIGQHPDLASAFAEAQTGSKAVLLRWLSIVIGIVVVAWYLLGRK